MLHRQHLFQEIPQLDLPPRSARLDVGQHSLEISHAGGEALHLAQPGMHLLQPFADHLEGFPQTFLQCGMKLLIDRLAHFLEFLAVILLQRLQAGFDDLADLLKLPLVHVGQFQQLVGERVNTLGGFTTIAGHFLAHEPLHAVVIFARRQRARQKDGQKDGVEDQKDCKKHINPAISFLEAT